MDALLEIRGYLTHISSTSPGHASCILSAGHLMVPPIESLAYLGYRSCSSCQYLIHVKTRCHARRKTHLDHPMGMTRNWQNFKCKVLSRSHTSELQAPQLGQTWPYAPACCQYWHTRMRGWESPLTRRTGRSDRPLPWHAGKNHALSAVPCYTNRQTAPVDFNERKVRQIML